MELQYDWKRFQDFFSMPRRKGAAVLPTAPVFLATDSGRVVAAYCDHADASEFVGKAVEEVAAGSPGRTLEFFDIQDLQGWVATSRNFPHFHESVEHLRACALGKASGRDTQPWEHFLLSLIRGRLSRFFPTSYGLLIRIDGNQPRDFLATIRGKTLDTFHTPDLSTLGSERARDPEAVVKYLSEKHMLPVQGVFVTADDWERWSDPANGDPLREIFQAAFTKRARLVPHRRGLVALLGLKTYLGF